MASDDDEINSEVESLFENKTKRPTKNALVGDDVKLTEGLYKDDVLSPDFSDVHFGKTIKEDIRWQAGIPEEHRKPARDIPNPIGQDDDYDLERKLNWEHGGKGISNLLAPEESWRWRPEMNKEEVAMNRNEALRGVRSEWYSGKPKVEKIEFDLPPEKPFFESFSEQARKATNETSKKAKQEYEWRQKAAEYAARKAREAATKEVRTFGRDVKNAYSKEFGAERAKKEAARRLGMDPYELEREEEKDEKKRWSWNPINWRTGIAETKLKWDAAAIGGMPKEKRTYAPKAFLMENQDLKILTDKWGRNKLDAEGNPIWEMVGGTVVKDPDTGKPVPDWTKGYTTIMTPGTVAVPTYDKKGKMTVKEIPATPSAIRAAITYHKSSESYLARAKIKEKMDEASVTNLRSAIEARRYRLNKDAQIAQARKTAMPGVAFGYRKGSFMSQPAYLYTPGAGSSMREQYTLGRIPEVAASKYRFKQGIAELHSRVLSNYSAPLMINPMLKQPLPDIVGNRMNVGEQYQFVPQVPAGVSRLAPRRGGGGNGGNGVLSKLSPFRR